MPAHAETDALTTWWRGVSLRAKITGVTVALLVIGLVAAGIGTMVFVRNALIAYQDEQIQSLAGSQTGAGLIQVVADQETGEVSVSLTENAPPDFYVAVYEPLGAFVDAMPASGGPQWDAEFPLSQTITQRTMVFDLKDDEGHTFHAAAGPLDPGVGQYYTQIFAYPLATVDRTLRTFVGVFSVIALLTVLAGALLTRLLVTRTFRPLGQVESAAMAISGGDFGRRLAPADPGTEVGRLTNAINTMLDRVDASLSERDATLRQMRRFIGDASHELRTPLVSVRGYAELYRIGAIRGDEDTAQAMERIEKEAVRMGVMVEDLLALARLDERGEVVEAAIDLRIVARDAAMDVRAAAPQRTIEVIDNTAAPIVEPLADTGAVTTDPDSERPRRSRRRNPARGGGRRRGGRAAARPGADDPRTEPIEQVSAIDLSTPEVGPAIAPPPIVLGDENKVRQVVANLLGNARRFSPPDSPIGIVVGSDPTARTPDAPHGMGWIEIADRGDGVPEQIRDLIFQRFWRADTSRARETGGSGLGLAIVASIVEALHGSVQVRDTPGGGATFRVCFPLARDAALHAPTQPITRLDTE